MQYNTFYNKVETDDQLMETIQHGTDKYPFMFYYDNLQLFDFHCVEWHWHAEFEFLYVEKGVVTISVADRQFDLTAGSGVFVNSKVLHRFYAKDEGIIPNFVCLPTFLAPEDSLIYTRYVAPLVASSIDYIALSPQVPWQSEVLALYREVIALNEKPEQNQLLVAAATLKIWFLLYQNSQPLSMRSDARQNAGALARLQLMMQYLHRHYAEPVSLAEVCRHVHISKSTAMNLFRRFLSTTPMQYRMQYRLQMAAKKIVASEKSVTGIAMECGFDSVDHFCKTFKKVYGRTPLQYRKERKAAP